MVYINDAVKLDNYSHIYDIPALQQLSMRLYTQIFAYLTRFMAWFTSRSRTRFLKSFNENIKFSFQEDLDNVKKISNLISQHIQTYMSADIKVSKLLSEDTNEDIKYVIQLQETAEEQAKMRHESHLDLIENVLRSRLEEGAEQLEKRLHHMARRFYEKTRNDIAGAAARSLLMQRASMEEPVTQEFPEPGNTLDGTFALVRRPFILNTDGSRTI